MADTTKQKGFIGFFKRLFSRIGKTFLDIRSELKKVIWPDWQKLRSSTLTIILICLVFGAVIWAVDFTLGTILTSIGFFDSTTPVSTVTPTAAPTSSVTVTPGATPTVTIASGS